VHSLREMACKTKYLKRRLTCFLVSLDGVAADLWASLLSGFSSKSADASVTPHWPLQPDSRGFFLADFSQVKPGVLNLARLAVPIWLDCQSLCGIFQSWTARLSDVSLRCVAVVFDCMRKFSPL
jgi:hypothetical protein